MKGQKFMRRSHRSSRATFVCGTCSKRRPLNSFAKDRNGSPRGACADCVARKPSKIKKNTTPKPPPGKRKVLLERLEAVNQLKTAPCVDCGRRYEPIQMDFDHVRGEKSGSVSKLVMTGAPLTQIMAEVAKTELRCSNCHRVKTEERKQAFSLPKKLSNKASKREKLRELIRKAKSRPCEDCGEQFPVPAMDLEHRDPSAKKDTVSTLANKLCTEEELQAEISQCRVLCSNCHRLRTYHRLVEKGLSR